MLLEKIRTQTRANHEQLESAMSPFIMQVSSVPDYARLLRFFYGYFKPLQDSIDTKIDRNILPDYDQRRRPGWILHDLAEIGEPTTTPIPFDIKAPSVHSPAEAIGALYVLEGSTLGGKIICKTIAANLGMTGKQGLSFFYGYGPMASVRWKDFMTAINTYTGRVDEDLIVRKADEVFAGFHKWFHVNYSQVHK